MVFFESIGSCSGLSNTFVQSLNFRQSILQIGIVDFKLSLEAQMVIVQILMQLLCVVESLLRFEIMLVQHFAKNGD